MSGLQPGERAEPSASPAHQQDDDDASSAASSLLFSDDETTQVQGDDGNDAYTGAFEGSLRPIVPARASSSASPSDVEDSAASSLSFDAPSVGEEELASSSYASDDDDHSGRDNSKKTRQATSVPAAGRSKQSRDKGNAASRTELRSSSSLLPQDLPALHGDAPAAIRYFETAIRNAEKRRKVQNDETVRRVKQRREAIEKGDRKKANRLSSGLVEQTDDADSEEEPRQQGNSWIEEEGKRWVRWVSIIEVVGHQHDRLAADLVPLSLLLFLPATR